MVRERFPKLKKALRPSAYHTWAKHWYKCKQDFEPPDDTFTPLPFFLLCRAIELQLKAWLLERKKVDELKEGIRHDLKKAYKQLNSQQQVLSPDEYEVLSKMSEIYKAQDFAYFNPDDGILTFVRFRSHLNQLDAIAKKLIDLGPPPA